MKLVKCINVVNDSSNYPLKIGRIYKACTYDPMYNDRNYCRLKNLSGVWSISQFEEIPINRITRVLYV